MIFTIFSDCPDSSAEEDASGPWATEGLVRGGGDDVCMQEGRGYEAGSHQAADVRHVSHQEGAAAVSYLSEPGIVQVSRVTANPCNDQLGLEQQRVAGQLFIVDKPSVRVHL